MLISEQNKRFIIIAPLSAVSKRLRLFKLAKFVNSNFDIQLSHIGWERAKGEEVENQLNFNLKKKIILRGGGYGGKVKYWYFLWILKVFFKSLTLKKSDIVWALGFESAFPALLASKVIGFKVIFDDADRFSLLFNFPNIIMKLIEKLERFTSRNVYLHIIPGYERYDFKSSKFYLLKNTPSEIELIKAKELFQEKDWVKADLVVNVNGWLGFNRGLNVILEVSRKLIRKNIKFILAGRLACQEAEELSKAENVCYLGNVSNAEALSSYFASDFVFTYFEPSIKINTLAESNKWGDAIKTGIGVIVNTEIKTAGYLKDAGAAITYNYYDIESLTNELIRVSEDRSLLTRYKENSNKLSGKFGFYEEQLIELFNS